jgi:predicted RNA-binding protein YlqC (UPF0109 family)
VEYKETEMAETIDQQFIEYIVKALVGNPDAVKVDRTIDEKGVLLELHVDPTDLGRVIGRNGATAKSIRTLLRALGTKNDARYNLKIVDNGPPREERERREEQPRDDQPQSDYIGPIQDDSAANDDNSADTVTEAAPSEEQAEVEVAQAPAEEQSEETPSPSESGLDRHREDLKELTDLDI